MPRSNTRKTRTEQATEVARKAAQAAAAAVLEAAEADEEDDDEMDESIQPGDDGRPKTQKGRTAPAAGGPAKDVKLGSEGPDAVKKSRVQENLDDEEDDDEMEESRRNPLGRFLNLEADMDDEEEDDEMKEGAADDQLTRTDDSARTDAQRKRQSGTHSGDIGNEITDTSHPAVPAGTAVVEAQMAGEQPRGAAAPNPGSPGDQLTGSDGDTQADAKRAGQRGDPGSGGKPSSGALDAEQTAKEKPLDPSAVGMDKTVAEATNALFNGEDLSEDFKTKASTIFGAALREVVQRHATNMTETYNGYLSEKVAEVQEHYEAKHIQLVERIDDYLGYVVEQWVSENKLAVETGLRADISDSFMKALHGIFKEHYIELPEDRVDAFTESQTRISELETQLGEQINSNVSLRKELSVKTVDEVFAEESDGLADTERERLRHLCEGVEFDDAGQYRQKVQILRENYFGRTAVNSNSDAEDVDEINTPSAPALEPKMSKYVQGMSRLAGAATPTGKFRQTLNG